MGGLTKGYQAAIMNQPVDRGKPVDLTDCTIAVGGVSTAARKAVIDAELASTACVEPRAVLVNLGVNDLGNNPIEATWKADYGYILDAFHAKWSDAQVYCMRVWDSNPAHVADIALLAEWIGDLVAARSGWANVGPDERVFLENGDNGATFTTDGVHPNAAGYILTGREWQSVIGP